MPYSTDEPKSDTVPDPEMNPLRNPLLAANMGRWAEVYFTTPPEKRPEAIAALLRELESTKAASSELPAEADSEAKDEAEFPAHLGSDIALSSAAAGESFMVEHVIFCAACGHANTEGQRFCGMCGSSLTNPPLAVEPEPPPAYIPRENPAGSFLGLSSPYPGSAASTSNGDFGNGHFSAQESSIYERSIPSFAVEERQVPYRYRMYVGAVLAILLTALIYMAWRGKKLIPGAAQSLSSTGVPAVQPEPTVQAPAVIPMDSGKPAQSSNSAASAGGDGSAAAPENGNAQPKSPVAEANQQPAPPLTTKKEHEPRTPAKQLSRLPATTPAADAGQQDLATAQRFLGGSTGSARDSREAATYLWKAVSKGNGTATVVLSDLYLHGDGVPKSCDQARLLLDLAAQKGAKGAAERLRNLQAFGCQ